MSQRCRICMNDNRLEMEKKIIQGKTISKIALEYGVSENSLSYHKKHHLSRQLIKDQSVRQMLSSKFLAEEMEAMITKTKSLMAKAETDGWYGIALSGIKEWRKCLQFMIQLSLTQKVEKDAEEKQEQEDVETKLRRLNKQELETLVKLNQKMDGKLGPHGSEIRILPKDEVIDVESVEPTKYESIVYRRRDIRKSKPVHVVPRQRKPFNAPDPVPILDSDSSEQDIDDPEPFDNEIRDAEGYTPQERSEIRPASEIAGGPFGHRRKTRPGDRMSGPVRTSRNIGLK